MGGITGLLLLIVVGLLFVGADKLPSIGAGLGRSVRNFKRSMKEGDEIDVTPAPGPGRRDDKRKD